MVRPRKSSRRQSRYRLILIPVMLLMLVSCSSQETVDDEQIRLHQQLAGELRDSKLFTAAIEEYREVLRFDGLSDARKANINYLIARIYFEDLKNYHNAAAYYMRARNLDPEGSFISEASQNLVASLQKIGNVVDAARELKSAADIEYQPPAPDDLPVARIAGEPIYRSQVEKELKALPPEVQKQFLDSEARVEFTRNYIGAELLYRAATREGYLDDPEIVRQAEAMTRRLVLDKYVSKVVMPKISVDTLDVRNFYEVNKETRFDSKPYDSVKSRVILEYQQDKAQAAYTDYINELAKTEQVEFLDKNW